MSLDERGTGPILRYLAIGLLLAVIALSSSSSSAVANPSPPGPDFESLDWLMYYLILGNWPIDLLCFASLVFIMCRVFGKEVGDVWQKPSVFIASVFLASIVIALSGALTDLFAFYEVDEAGGYWLAWGGNDPIIESPSLYLALAAIFLSVAAVSYFIVRINRTTSIYIATGMTAINFASWMIILNQSGSMFMTIIVFAWTIVLVVGIVPLYFLWKWRSRLNANEPRSVSPNQTNA